MNEFTFATLLFIEKMEESFLFVFTHACSLSLAWKNEKETILGENTRQPSKSQWIGAENLEYSKTVVVHDF